MNFSLFEPKVCDSASNLNFCHHHLIYLIALTRETAMVCQSVILFHVVHLLHWFLDEERLKETQQHSVDDQYECYWTAAKAKNYCCIMPVFDTNDALVGPNRFSEKPVDAMCEVTFTLKHYTIAGHRKAGEREMESHNFFSAQVETVIVLKKPPTIARSPYKSHLTRRPHHRPQLPTRGEQVNAAVAFVPHPSFRPLITDTSTIPALVTHTQTAQVLGLLHLEPLPLMPTPVLPPSEPAHSG